MEIKQAFENIWKIKSINKKFKKEDKERYYDLFLDGYGCALINLEDSHKHSKTKREANKQ